VRDISPDRVYSVDEDGNEVERQSIEDYYLSRPEEVPDWYEQEENTEE